MQHCRRDGADYRSMLLQALNCCRHTVTQHSCCALEKWRQRPPQLWLAGVEAANQHVGMSVCTKNRCMARWWTLECAACSASCLHMGVREGGKGGLEGGSAGMGPAGGVKSNAPTSKEKCPRQDSNLQSFASEANTLSIRPHERLFAPESIARRLLMRISCCTRWLQSVSALLLV